MPLSHAGGLNTGDYERRHRDGEGWVGAVDAGALVGGEDEGHEPGAGHIPHHSRRAALGDALLRRHLLGWV